MIDLGHFNDRNIPPSVFDPGEHADLYQLNSQGYRCAEWSTMPAGKKNVVVLGCSHTFGEGLAEHEHWVHYLSQHNTKRLRYWNLAQPGASADRIVRTLWGSEQVIDPKIVVICWPVWSRREILDVEPISAHGDHEELARLNDTRDKNNFLMNVFWVEKYAEKNHAQTFHCFAQEDYHGHIQHVAGINVMPTHTISNCWPYWHKVHNTVYEDEPSVARDGKHFGVEHHKRFTELFLERFGSKLK